MDVVIKGKIFVGAEICCYGLLIIMNPQVCLIMSR